ncbi:MAG: sigma-70 family RNA polymerase sigma factor [Deltaproteobacteria bacterium]|nr:sigma-70 family RNA polymerase sigma factor [Deltaproteobacteria bacterium]
MASKGTTAGRGKTTSSHSKAAPKRAAAKPSKPKASSSPETALVLASASEETSDEPEVLVGEVVSEAGHADDDLLLGPDEHDETTPLFDDPLHDLQVTPRERPSPLAPIRDPLQRFLSEARSFRRLTESEEKELVAAARGQGDIGAARRLVVHNLRLVVTIAYQYRRAWTNILDLFQEGSVGLMEAVRRWDPQLGTRFGTYAAYWIRAYILKFLMTNARLIHVGNTRAGRKLFFRLEKERAKLRAAGFDPTPKLLAANLNVDEKDVLEVSQHLASREVSFEPRPDEDDGVSLSERIASPDQASPEQQAGRNMLADQVRHSMDAFALSLTDERERAVWAEHLAAPDDPVALSELGERYGVSKQRIGQIADKLKKRFRDALVEQLGPEIQMSWQPDQDE